MQFHYMGPQTSLEVAFGGFFCINAIGKIERGDDLRFKEFLIQAKPPPRSVVYIDSVGGDVDSAMKIGRMIRGSWFSTDVGQYQLDFQGAADGPILPRKKYSGQCLSAATLMYLGGRLRHLDNKSWFGVHQFSFPSAVGDSVPRFFLAESQSLSARISEYVVEMGISTQFLLLSAGVPSTAIHTLGKSELEAIGVVTGGLKSVVWTLEANNGVSYVKGERDSIFGHHKVMLCFNKEQGFLFWSVLETQGRSHELQSFPLVEIVINGEEERLDVSSRVARSEVGIYTHLLSPISDDEAMKIAFSNSFGVQVRFSKEAEVFLGAAAMDTETGKMKLKTFFENHKSS